MIKNGTVVSYEFSKGEIIYGIILEYLSPDGIYKVRVTNTYIYNELEHYIYYLTERDLTIIGE